jgi:hypothetical protein
MSPIRAVNQSPDLRLQLAVAYRVSFAEKERQLGREFLASFDELEHGIRQVLQMEEGLSDAKVAWINLVRDKRIAAEVVIHSGRPQIDHRDLTALVIDEALRFDLRRPIRQLGFEWPIFRD